MSIVFCEISKNAQKSLITRITKRLHRLWRQWKMTKAYRYGYRRQPELFPRTYGDLKIVDLWLWIPTAISPSYG
jgi:hypothetical protein